MVQKRILGRVLLGVVVSVALVVAASACGTKSAVPNAQPMPTGKSYSGVWYSPQFEHMHLKQTGDKVSGIFTYRQGGRLEGTVDGNLLVFDWVEPGDKTQARRTMKGSGYLRLVEKGDKTMLLGEWGYNDQVTGGGPWKAEYVRELEPEDPLTLQALEESRD